MSPRWKAHSTARPAPPSGRRAARSGQRSPGRRRTSATAHRAAAARRARRGGAASGRPAGSGGSCCGLGRARRRRKARRAARWGEQAVDERDLGRDLGGGSAHQRVGEPRGAPHAPRTAATRPGRARRGGTPTSGSSTIALAVSARSSAGCAASAAPSSGARGPGRGCASHQAAMSVAWRSPANPSRAWYSTSATSSSSGRRRRTPSGPGCARARARAANSRSYQCTRQCSSTSGRPASRDEPDVEHRRRRVRRRRASRGGASAVDARAEVVARDEHVDVARGPHRRVAVQRPREERPLERDVRDPGRLERGRDAQCDELVELAGRRAPHASPRATAPANGSGARGAASRIRRAEQRDEALAGQLVEQRGPRDAPRAAPASAARPLRRRRARARRQQHGLLVGARAGGRGPRQSSTRRASPKPSVGSSGRPACSTHAWAANVGSGRAAMTSVAATPAPGEHREDDERARQAPGVARAAPAGRARRHAARRRSSCASGTHRRARRAGARSAASTAGRSVRRRRHRTTAYVTRTSATSARARRREPLRRPAACARAAPLSSAARVSSSPRLLEPVAQLDQVCEQHVLGRRPTPARGAWRPPRRSAPRAAPRASRRRSR